MEDGAFDDDTLNFVQLWDYVQGMPEYPRMLDPEDVVLMDELVTGQNFAVALDLLRHRVRHYNRLLPEELRDIARPQKCIRVRDVAASGAPPIVAAPPPPVTRAELDDVFRSDRVVADGGAPEADMDARAAREQLRMQQDEAYARALARDQEQAPPVVAEPVPPDVVVDEPLDDPSALLVCVQLPGERRERRFLPSHTFAQVQDWLNHEGFPVDSLCTNFPAQSWEGELASGPVSRGRMLLIARFNE